MKKLIILLVAFSACANFMYAQNDNAGNKTDYREKLLFGFKAGANYANVYDTKGEDFRADPKFGLAFGAFVAIPIGEYIGIQPEILFSQKGFKGTGAIQTSKYALARTSTYIDVPVLFAFKPSEFITVVAGPEYSFLLEQKDVFSNNSNVSYQQTTSFAGDDVRKSVFGLTGGADITAKHLVFGTRIGWDLLDNRADQSSTTPRYKNLWFQGTLGYRFYAD